LENGGVLYIVIKEEKNEQNVMVLIKDKSNAALDYVKKVADILFVCCVSVIAP